MNVRILKAKRNPKTGCLEWFGTKNHDGYGQVRYKRKCLAVHRVVFLLCIGPIDNQLQVLHKCDNPKCVEPSHLFLGTQRENVADMIKKGRARFSLNGEKNPNSKLTAADVRYIRNHHIARGDKKILAKKFGVSRSLVSQIINNDAWKYEECYGSDKR